jgi:recombinational DNA repair ATPase RecF
VVASTTAWADPSATDRAHTAEMAAEQRMSQLAAQRSQLTARYQDELSAIDRLKKQRASWRRDRELNTAQADAKDTADKLAVLDKQIASAQQTVAGARAAVIAAIDAELPTATGPRAQALAKLRAQLAPPKVVKKIVIPDASIDPLADPDEL